MKIYSLMLVKNEADIIASTLRAAAQWSDKVIVMDNGSTDNTWEIVTALALEFPQIIPFAQDDQPFKIGLRALMFDRFKSELNSDDWWCIRLDADEFFYDSPRSFLSAIPLKYKQVCKASIDFAITPEDVEEFDFFDNFEDNKSKIRYYNPFTWSEIRFLRHSSKLRWNIDKFKPEPCGLTYPAQIKVLHYQFRSPKQMQERFNIRQKARQDGCGSFKHEQGSTWKDYLKLRSELKYWDANAAPEVVGNRNKFNKTHTRVFKSILTFFGYYS
jgi:glycosyltransferase involved in cell wall biosynthesis